MSIRLRLALWYGALLALVLAVTLTVTFVVHVRTHESDVDASLRGSWEHAVAELSGMPMATMMGSTLTAPTQAGSAPTATWLLVPGSARRAVGDANDTVLSHFDPSAVRDGLQDTGLDGTRVRSYAGSVPGASGTRLIVAASMSAFDASVRSLGLILGVMGLAGVALAATGGWAISAGALRPIAKMTETAQAIALSRGFARRIDVSEDGRDELSELGRTFNHMLSSLDDAYRRQQRFVADVSHELRTPLTALQGDLELLVRGQLPRDESNATLAEARQETHRLARLVDDLQELWRAEARQLPLHIQSIDAAAVARIYKTIRPRLNEAYQNMGHPGGDVDAAVQQAIDILLNTPVVKGPVPLVEGAGARWAYADPDLEALTPTQKQLVRMGPAHTETMLVWLRALQVGIQ